MYVRQHSFKCWSASHRPRKTTVVYIILSIVLFSSEYPTLHKPAAKKLDLAESLLFSRVLLDLELHTKAMWNAACRRHEISSETNQFPWEKKPSKNMEYEYKIAQCGMRCSFWRTEQSALCGTWLSLVVLVLLMSVQCLWALGAASAFLYQHLLNFSTSLFSSIKYVTSLSEGYHLPSSS